MRVGRALPFHMPSSPRKRPPPSHHRIPLASSWNETNSTTRFSRERRSRPAASSLREKARQAR
jgi:hypothetical protein